MSKPVLLDLFSGAGGSAMGYHRAGFEPEQIEAFVKEKFEKDFPPGSGGWVKQVNPDGSVSLALQLTPRGVAFMKAMNQRN